MTVMKREKRSSRLISHSSPPFYHPSASVSHLPVPFPDPLLLGLPFRRRNSRVDRDWLDNRNCILFPLDPYHPATTVFLQPGSNIMEPCGRNPCRAVTNHSLCIEVQNPGSLHPESLVVHSQNFERISFQYILLSLRHPSTSMHPHVRARS